MQELLDWYRGNARDLPWRRTRDPWAVWVSEAMLQQTRVETVIPYWEKFLERFPTPAALAAAPEQEVLHAWAGLGYYRRARHLQSAAREVVTRYGGEVPAHPAAFRELPGVGRYTAGAVMSIAFGLPEPILDGNVTRVLCRLFAVEGDPRSPVNQRRLWEIAADIIPEGEARDFNQALMELGARVCTPTGPACLACPVAPRCEALARGLVDRLPETVRKAPPREIAAVCAVLTDPAGRWLLAERPPGGLLAGMWEFPGAEVAPGGETGGSDLARALAGALAERVGIGVAPAALARVASVTHIFTHRRLTLTAFTAASFSGTPAPRGYPAVRWVEPRELGADAGIPLPKVTRKVVAALAARS